MSLAWMILCDLEHNKELQYIDSTGQYVQTKQNLRLHRNRTSQKSGSIKVEHRQRRHGVNRAAQRTTPGVCLDLCHVGVLNYRLMNQTVHRQSNMGYSKNAICLPWILLYSNRGPY